MLYRIASKPNTQWSESEDELMRDILTLQLEAERARTGDV